MGLKGGRTGIEGGAKRAREGPSPVLGGPLARRVLLEDLLVLVVRRQQAAGSGEGAQGGLPAAFRGVFVPRFPPVTQPVDAGAEILEELDTALGEDELGFVGEGAAQRPLEAAHGVAFVLPDVGPELHLQQVGVEPGVVLRGERGEGGAPSGAAGSPGGFVGSLMHSGEP